MGEYRADGEKQEAELGGGGKQMPHHEEFTGFAKNPGLVVMRVLRHQ